MISMFDPETGLLPLHVELGYDGEWHEITDDVVASAGIQIRRGRDDFQSSPDPATCSLTIDNRDGKYSPKNPLSPLYGKIQRNTPLRVRVGDPDTRVVTGEGAWLSTAPAHVEDIDIRIELEGGFDVAEQSGIARQYLTTDDQRSWALTRSATGHITFGWSADGTDFFGVTSDQSLEELGYDAERVAIRAVHVFDPDADESTDTIFAASSIEGPWGIVAGPSTYSGHYPLFDSSAPIELGRTHSRDQPGVPSEPFIGSVRAFEIRDASDGSLVMRMPLAELWFKTPPMGTPETSIEDDRGRTWTLHNTGVSDRSTRFVGDVTAWPPRWSGPEDAHTLISATGYRRRVDRAKTPLRSSLHRANIHPSQAHRVLGYWPMEESEYATQFASGVDESAMQVGRIVGYHLRDTEFASYDGFRGSEPLPTFHRTDAVGHLRNEGFTGEVRVQFLLYLDEDMDLGTERTLVNLRMTGSAAEWSIRVWNRPDYGKRVILYWIDTNGNEHRHIQNQLGWDFKSRVMMGFILYKDVNDLYAEIYRYAEDHKHRWWSWAGPISQTLGAPTSVVIGFGSDLEGTSIGHVSVWNRDIDDYWDEIVDGFHGWAGETAASRLARIGAEENIPIVVSGDAAGSEQLDAQGTTTLAGLLDSAAETDMGILVDKRDAAALEYRTRASLYNQDPIVFSYVDDPIVAPLEPTDDDADTANEVTVQRDGGSSSRAVLESGPMSTLPPPEGLGRMDVSHTLSLFQDTQAGYQADWRLHLGTVDEIRYPRITLAMHDKPSMIERAMSIDVGDRVQITDLPSWLPPGPADVIVQGYEEWTDGVEWNLTLNGTPASAWRVVVADDPVLGRVDTSGSELASALGEDDTLVSVRVSDGEDERSAWSDDREQLPYVVDIGGEHVRFEASNAIRDSFEREVTEGWGMPSSSTTAWQIVGNAEEFSVSGGSGRIVVSDSEARFALHDTGIRNTDIRATVSFDRPPESGPHIIGLFGRYTDSSNYYIARMIVYVDRVDLDIVKLVDGEETFVNGSGTDLLPVEDVRFNLRFQLDGDALRMAVWQNGEPDAWDVEGTDVALPDRGDIGIYARRASSAAEDDPVTMSFHHVESEFLDGVQQFRVTRSINNIRKSHSAGAPVRLAYPAVLAL